MSELNRQFSREDRASIAHALMHLCANKVADDDDFGHSGWYCGNKMQFVRRHRKAIDLMRSLLKQNVPADGSAVADTVRRDVGSQP